MPRTLTLEPAALCFAASVTLAAAEGAATERAFSGVAYGGGVITDHMAFDAVGFDLTGLTAAAPMPLLLQHDSDRVIGVIDSVRNDGAQLAIAGRLFTGADADARAVAAKADAGLPWQMSVGIFFDRLEEVAPGAVFALNGRDFMGPALLARQSRVREVSFVALGADSSTRASVFGRDAAPLTLTVTPFTAGEPQMADITQEQFDAEKQRADDAVAALAAEKARADAAEAEFAARERTERETAVKALLGDTFSAELAAPYLDMSGAQFAAVQALAKARPALPEGFTVEQAKAGKTGAEAVTPEAINKYRAENPGATYEQAFAALKGGAPRLPATFAG